jgi:hypothetical protein
VFWLKKIKSFVKRIREQSRTIKSIATDKWDFCVIAFDWVYCHFRFHITMDEYLKYSFYNYKNRYRKHYMLIHHRKKYHYFQTRHFTRSKYLFYKRIPDLFAREIILAPQCGQETFIEFFKKHKRIVTKPDTGSLGRNISIVEYTDDAAAKALFAQFNENNPFVCEEFIYQHDVMNKLNPYSVNTVRVMSVLVNGQVEITSATLRAGVQTASIVDNLKSGGLGAAVDVTTGIVTTFGKDYQFHTYSHHPITGVQIIGLNIPHWDKVIALIKEAHIRLPQCLLYGWDIAITPEGVDIIEANNAPGPMGNQAMDCIPKGYLIEPLMKKDILKQGKTKKKNNRSVPVIDYSAIN